MGMPLAILNRRRRGGNPDASYLIAYRFTDPADYTITTGRVSAVRNRGIGSATYDAVQSVAADRPTLGAMTDGTPALVFTTGNEWLEADAIGAALSGTSDYLELDITFENNNIGTVQTLLCFHTGGSNNGFQTIGTDGTGDIRLQRRDNTGAINVNVDSLVKITANTTQTLSLVFSGGLVSGYLNGQVAFNAADYIGTAGAISANRLSFGARELAAVSLPFDGEISFLGIKQ